MGCLMASMGHVLENSAGRIVGAVQCTWGGGVSRISAKHHDGLQAHSDAAARLPGCPGRVQVVDEADRLLRQAYQDWLPHVLAAMSHQVHAPDSKVPAAAEPQQHSTEVIK